MIYADIIVDISHDSIDRVFQYAVPPDMEKEAVVGVRVDIPFGQGNRIIKGYIVGLSDKPNFDVNRIKEIKGIDTKSVAIESQLISLAYYIKEYFGSTMNDALKVVIPVKNVIKTKEKKYISINVDEDNLKSLIFENYKKNNKARVRFLKAFEEKREWEFSILQDKYNISKSVLDYFVESAVVSIKSDRVYRNPIKAVNCDNTKKCLNEVQQSIVDDFIDDYCNDVRKTYLLHGVTGSGKTEVYLSMIEYMISLNKQVIVLIPEIALTYQTVNRFYARFGDRVSILNSRMSQGERYDQYQRAKNGEIDIIIGPRSALFVPFSNLGLIIIDEEHESSYKSESVPKYHAREVAIERARIANASVFLGSATPSLEAYYNAQTGKYKLYKMTKRANDAVMPKVWVEDLREELKCGNKSIFSRRLKTLIDDRLAKGEQIMLFLNRRGYSGFVSCRSCGYVAKCPHCDISLTFHNTAFRNRYNTSQGGKLVCHYCGYETNTLDECPECGSDYIALFGTGTQKIEELVKKTFPAANVLRMDADTTSGKEGHANILSAFSKGEADILIGTQMIVKGHDFHKVTLVGIIAADLSLNTNDYRAAERTFALLTQAAGRAGRGNRAGEVVIQTYRPEHYSITTSAKCDYEEFYDKEIMYRKMMKYPPVSNVLVMLVVARDEELVLNCTKDMMNNITPGDNYSIIGPANATLSKANDMYRRVVYFKSNNYNVLRELKLCVETWHKGSDIYKKCSIYYDYNPIFGY